MPDALKACDFCAIPPAAPIYTVNGHAIVECKRCGIAYVADPPPIERLQEGYNEEYFQGKYERGYENYLKEREERERVGRRRLKEIEGWVKPGRLLDIGCAAGFFLSAARQRGWDVHGTEISEYCVRFAREELGIETVQCSPAEQMEYEPGSFDLITLWDCVEHLHSPKPVFEKAAEALRPGGVLTFSTGEWRSLGVKFAGKNWRLMTPPAHLFFFSHKFFRDYLSGLGLEVIDHTTNSRLIPGSLWRTKRIKKLTRRFKLGDVMVLALRKR